jgi:hypothetical protein
LDRIEKIQQEIQQLGQDIRAEVVVAQVLQHTGRQLPLIVHTDDFFYRQFSKDITRVDIGDSYDLKEILHLHLSRTGLYDVLPEGLFFKPLSSAKIPKNAGEMAEEYKANKRQEQEVRKFFAPLENDFFYHRYKNFAAEASLLKGLNNDYLNRYFTEFWQLPDDMPPGMALRMILLLPYIHEMAGDAELMAASLQAIIAEEVGCKLVTESSQQTGLHYNVLSTFELGNGLTCGINYEEEDFCFAFTIFNLERSSAQDYLTGGRLYSTLQTFYRFFLPAGTSIKTTIKVQAAKENMHIGTGEEAVLGIATVL